MTTENTNQFSSSNENLDNEYLKKGDMCFLANDCEGAILFFSKIIDLVSDDPSKGYSELQYQALIKRGEVKKLTKDKKVPK